KGTASGLVPWKLLTENDFSTTPHIADAFGYALAARKMNGDAMWDLVIGAPGYETEGHTGAGAVFTYVGSSSGPIPGSMITERAANGVPEAEDFFGAAIAMGSYDGVHSQVAIGAVGEKVGSSKKSTGWVAVLDWIGDSLLASAQNIAPPSTTPDGAEFGSALLTMNYTSGSIDDLVIAAVNDGDGIVRTYRGSSSGLSLDQTITSPSGRPEFGTALAAGKFRGASRPELAISSDEDVNDSSYAGAVHLYMPNASGVFAHEQTLVTGLNEEAQFGLAMAAGDFNNDGNDELVVGAPGVNQGGGQFGEVFVFKGAAGGPMSLWGDRVIHPETLPTQNGSFGFAVAIGDFDHAGSPLRQDMVIGAPFATVGLTQFAGLFDEYKGDGTIPNWIATHTEGGN
ncbi:MAG TPA: hypothetical protein VGO00_21825, partial [Kofleriaceae bacterium]|nr:hypothetical protein [Kofleriaceae bacterium]